MSILSQFKQSQNTDFPNVRPSLDLRFALAKKLDPRITFTRGSTGTYFGSDGLMRTAGVNEPRFDHDPITGQSLGLLIEETRINYFTYSDIEGSVGSTPTGAVVPYTSQGQSVVVSTDVFLGPNGQSAKHTKGVQQNDSNTGYFNVGGVLTAGQTYCASIWLYIPSSQAKNFAGKTITFQAENVPSVTTTTAIFDTTLIGVWQRTFCVFTASTTGTSIIPRTNANAGSFFYTDCWQLELGSFPTSYMPASGGSQFTRNPDNAYMIGTNFSSWYNQSEGSILVSTDKLISGNFDTYRHYYLFSSGSGANTITSYTVANAIAITNYGISNAGRQVFDYQLINIGSSPTQFKIGQALNSKYSFFTSSKGTTPPQLPSKSAPNGQNLSIPTNLTQLSIGCEYYTSFNKHINSHIARLTYYPIQLTNQQLINLSS